MPGKKPTNLSLDQNLLAEAKELGINLSQAAEAGLSKSIADRKAEIWKIQNRKALKSSCDWVEKYSLPLSDFRQF